MFGVVYGAADTNPSTLEEVAREFSPRIDVCGAREIAIDLQGVSRLFGDAREIAHELRRTAADRGVRVRVAIAATRTAARLLVRYRAGLTVIEPGMEAAVLAPLPIALLDAIASIDDPQSGHELSPGARAEATNGSPASSHTAQQARTGSARHYRMAPVVPQGAAADLATVVRERQASSPSRVGDDVVTRTLPPTDTLRQWGLRTLGEFAALASDAVAARLGQPGVWWQRIARGEDPAPLVPAVPDERFEQALDLEWPIEGLEPLSFVLGRLMEPLSAHLERRDRGAAVLHVRLHLVTRTVHERTLQLPVAMRDPRTLRTLALLDLESNPPTAAIDRVVVAVDPTPGRIVQYSLLTRPLPSPEQLSTLMARLTALMGERHCGAPAVVDSWRPGAFAMQPFAPREVTDSRPHGPRSHGVTEANRVSSLHASSGDGVSRGDGHMLNDTARRAGEEMLSSTDGTLVAALRRFRFPVPARVRMEHGKPVRVVTDRRGLHGGCVERCAGPWRTSGAWWEEGGARGDAPIRRGEGGPVHRSLAADGLVQRRGEGGWDCDEWDVTLADGATYRLSRARDVDQWFIEGIVD